MTRPEALLDAALTVQRWKREPLPERRDIRIYLGRQLRCTPSWPAIQENIIRRLLAQDAEPMRRAA